MSIRPSCPVLLAALALALLPTRGRAQEVRHRARDLGIPFGDAPTGPRNAITDVPGVRVGQVTVTDGESIHTGVTAILPHGGNWYQEKVRAACFVGNGFGKLVGTTQVAELGTLETPILLTGTLSTFRVADALISVILELPGNEQVRSVNPVVGETNDGLLSDIRRRPITAAHVREAVAGAVAGPVEEGSVGAGTGTVCFGFKGGIGSSSRVVGEGDAAWTVGVLVQTNFGGDLRVAGVPVSRAALVQASREDPGDGSCMIVVATDAPLDARQLGRLARRAVYGLARVGAGYTHGSGDYAIAFSTERATSDRGVPDESLSPLFGAVLEAVEESVLNSLCMARTTVGFGQRPVPALPLGPLVSLLKAHGIPAVLPPRGGDR